MLKIRLLALPSTARLAGPGPKRLIELDMNISPLVNTILPETPVASTVSPMLAAPMALRNEPGPLSARLETVLVAADEDVGAIARLTTTMHTTSPNEMSTSRAKLLR